jgi:hypothetical protein
VHPGSLNNPIWCSCMASASGGGPNTPSVDITAFSSFITSLPKPSKHPSSHFVKKLDEISTIPIQDNSINLVLCFVENGLIGQFTGIWPSPRAMATWIDKNWTPLIKGHLSHSFCARVFFAFLFEEKKIEI